MEAVITADIVNSTKLDNRDFQLLLIEIQEQFPECDKLEFYRGDSFQVLVKDAATVYHKMLQCRLKAISHSMQEARVDIRQSISLGYVAADISNLDSHLEDIFVTSGRALDRITDPKSQQHLLITCGDAIFDISYDLIAHYTDSLVSQVTAKQAEVLYYLLLGKNQKEAATLLKKSAATINQQVKAARFEEMAYLLEQYKVLTQAFIEHGK